MKKRRSKQTAAQTNSGNTLEDFRYLSNQIMNFALRGLLRIDFLHEASKTILEFSGCDSVEMWLRERGKSYRCEVTHSSSHPFHFEIMHTKQKGEKLTYRSAVNEKFKSIISIPISVENKNIGLLQLKSTLSDFFKKEEVEFYEGFVQTLGVALTHRRTQVEVRERVKELTCLFGIAKLVERTGISLKEILQGILELLPPALLYPEDASARIILDKHVYKFRNFQEKGQKLSAKIIVGGEQRGVVEVLYDKKKPELDEGPFLREERNLLDTVAREVALIAERKQSEQDKEKLQEQLRHADRLATIGLLSAGVAHELNEPIGSILGFAQLIKKSPVLSEQVTQDTEKIMKASLHAREVIRKLMLFARQTPPNKTRVNLNKVVEESLYFLESRCAKEGIRVVRSLYTGLPEVTADPAQLTQVFVNVVVNAIQAMPKGGELKIQTIASDEFVSLIVEDTGVGMTENVKKKIFLPFFTSKEVGQGTGLGLAVVHGIVTSHGGNIDVESRVGQGTKFEIQLPLKEDLK